MGVSENAIELRHAEAEPAIAACLPVLCQLRPHLGCVTEVSGGACS